MSLSSQSYIRAQRYCVFAFIVALLTIASVCLPISAQEYMVRGVPVMLLVWLGAALVMVALVFVAGLLFLSDTRERGE